MSLARSRSLLAFVATTAVGTLGFAGSAAAATFAANPPSLGPITDHATGCDATGATPRNVTFTVTGMTAPISDVQVGFTMSPILDWAGDLEVVLLAPNGASKTILGRTGTTTAAGCGDSSDLAGPYTFSDGATAPPSGGWWQAATAAAATAEIPSGTYRATNIGGAGAVNPQPPTTITPSFTGVPNPNGTWTLRFSDHGGGGVGAVGAATVSIVGADTTAPQTQIDSGPADGASLASTAAAFTFSANDPASTFECKLDDDVFAACASPKDYSGLSNGSHTFSVRASDIAVNVDASPATRTWAADTTPPETQIDSAKAKKRKAKFSFSSSESGSTFKCKLDKKVFESCTSPQKLKRLKSGKHKFSVEAIDAAGNVDATPATARVKVHKPR